MAKYGNKQAKASDGKVFASKRECARYEELLLLQRMGKIKLLETQAKYLLIPTQDTERSVSYIADFSYQDVDSGRLHVEDTKGFKTKDYVIKRKLMLYMRGIRIEEV